MQTRPRSPEAPRLPSHTLRYLSTLPDPNEPDVFEDMTRLTPWHVSCTSHQASGVSRLQSIADGERGRYVRAKDDPVQRLVRDNSLSLVMFGFFALFLLAQSVTGFRVYNDDQREHGEEAIPYADYLRTGHFIEATFENWESEYLQMGAYVLFTVYLFQRGSAESKDPDTDEPVDEDPRHAKDRPDAPWPVRLGGPVLRLYEHSLASALLLLFLISFVLHAIGGAREYSQEQVAHGGSAVSTMEFLRTSEFWFQSFQNWQSEFLAVFSLVVLSIILRQRGSPESKPVAAAHSETGTG